MKRSHVLGGIVTAAVLAAGGFGIDAALSGPPASGSPAAPELRIDTAALPPGTALVDDHGRTLYLFEADMDTTSACTGACTQVWPPLLAQGGTPAASGAVQAPLLGSTARPDGSRQVTYHGHPLYYFVGDRNPGEARGQGVNGFGGPWYVVAPTGDKIDPDSAAGADPDPAPAAGRYGY